MFERERLNQEFLANMEPGTKVTFLVSRDDVLSKRPSGGFPTEPLITRSDRNDTQTSCWFIGDDHHPTVRHTLNTIMHIVDAWNMGLTFAGLKFASPIARDVNGRRIPYIEAVFGQGEGGDRSLVRLWSTLELTLERI